MHMSEEHTVPWARRMHAGFDVLGLDGHTCQVQLQWTYHSVSDNVQQFLLTVKERLLSVALQNVVAISPPKRIEQ